MDQDLKRSIFLFFIGVTVGVALTATAWIVSTASSSQEVQLAVESTAAVSEAVTEASQAPAQTVPVTTMPAPTKTTLPEETTVPETQPPTQPAETEPVKITIDSVPVYYQTDYPNDRYGTGTIANSGCNMTSLAMVASYMTDHAYYPDEIADDLAHFIGNNYERLEYGSDLLQLSWTRARNVHYAINAVKEGKVAIVMMNGKSLFTNTSHFIVLAGINEAGRIIVIDPNRNNYGKASLKKGFEEGFTEGQIIAGFEGGWIYDKSAMPEEPFIYEPEPPAAQCRYPGLELSQADMDLIADLICMEGESEPFEGQQAIAEVILNRLYSGNFQNSVHSIIHAEDQFTAADRLYLAEPTYTQYKAIEQAMYGPYVLPIDVVFFAKFAVNDNVWGRIGAHTFCYSY